MGLFATGGCGTAADAPPAGPVCGNGVVETGEACDDGNRASGDGCSGACAKEVPAPKCGDGKVADTEECDDGNTDDGDGCSSMCAVEIPETLCGNGEEDEGEECDDGNTSSGDGCSATCRIEEDVAVCGNGTEEGVEECDDGNVDNGDGCSASCTIEVAPMCGNGTREAGEGCDDGNIVDGDGCSAECQKETTGPVCGNGVLEGTEACDDGNTMAGDGCDAHCVLENGVCGDGVLNVGEECDDGNTEHGDGCDHACHLEAPVCPNGKLEVGEECDDGNAVGCDGCTPACKFEVCGNAVVDCNEQCDDGNGVDGDGCDQHCMLEAEAGCGNGVVEAGEQCDDGNTTAGDGCAADCTKEATEACTPAANLACGDFASGNNGDSGATSNIGTYTRCVDNWDESGPEYTYTFVATTTSKVRVAVYGSTADLDVFVLGDADGACGPATCIAFGDSEAAFTTKPGETYYVVVDGYSGAVGPFSVYVGCGSCGDTLVDPDEQCDDGNTTDGDGCSAACQLESCGNSTVEAGEGCDDGNTTAGDGCSAACQLEECGNFIVDAGEGCDDGNRDAGDGCSADCQFEAGACTVDFDLACGLVDNYDTTFSGSTSMVDYYSCVPWREDGPEYAYKFVAATSGPVTVALSGLSSDLDLFVMGDTEDAMCTSASCLAFGNDKVTFTTVAGTTYYVVVDGYDAAEGGYTLSVSCFGGACGDSVVNTGEQCDDGNTTAGDGCSDKCVAELCGDSTVQAGLGEECDDGNLEAGDGCSPSCHSELGRCQGDFSLMCGNSDVWRNDDEGSTDEIDAYACAPGWDESGPEYAYEFAPVTSTEVTVELSGMSGGDLDLFVIQDSGENVCDPTTGCIAHGDFKATFMAEAGRRYFIVVDGNTGSTSPYTLELTCTFTPECGNGELEDGEQCDDGNVDAGDGCSDTCTLEAGSCQAGWRLFCNSTDDWSTQSGAATTSVVEYGCNSGPEEGAEYTYAFTAKEDGHVSVSLAPEAGVDLDLLVLLDSGNGCVPGSCLVWGDDAVEFTAKAGTTYYLVVEGATAADEGTFHIAVDCM